MSEYINNREHRQNALKEIIMELHQGKPLHEVKAKFEKIAGDLDAAELSLIEQKLINEGLPVAEVQRLCDVHAAVFRDALTKNPDVKVELGHPVEIFMTENRALEKLIKDDISPVLNKLRDDADLDEKEIALDLAGKLNLLWDIDKHYSRKENLIFPFVERYGITGPPKVMWGVDDKIRDLLKQAKHLAIHYQPTQKEQLIEKTEEALAQIDEMVFKEEKIFFPMALEKLTQDEWFKISEDSDEIGYCLIEPAADWKAYRDRAGAHMKENRTEHYDNGYIKFDTGLLTPKEIDLIFKHLPIDITYVDKGDVVKFFSATPDRVFARTRTIIGRKVENCHPPDSVHIVESIVNDFKSGKKNNEDFWIKMGEKYVYIRYFAVRDEQGEYVGTIEVTQDIKPIQRISGEKRILD
ncbi:hypothetical protein SDC9_87366 [bioreactor metagenome]|uniref:Hemerythrin-like domain-containing protein n=1 Tax=bioreactor metagenome TaxID=1076179 RepID=A0A644ZK64_9ZZZZ